MTRTIGFALALLTVAGCGDEPQPTPPAAAVPAVKSPVDRYQATLKRLRVTPPASPWADRQKQQFAALLGKHQAEILVVPLQVNGSGLDRVERRLIDMRLAQYLAASIGRPVADPVLVARALGEGQRWVASSEVYALAQSMNVDTLVWPHAGHDGRGRVLLTVRVQVRDGGGWEQAGLTDWGVSFSDEELPGEALLRILPEVAALIDDSAKPPAVAVVPRVDQLALPASPAAMLSAQGESAAVHAYHLQLLALLHPIEPELGQERALVRALAAVDMLAPDSPDVRLLKARALFHLDRRPAALRALGTPETASERALLAVLNGNLPELERETAQIQSPVHRLLAELELAQLRQYYGLLERSQFVRDVVPRVAGSPEWSILLHRRYMEWDRWEQESNLELKAFLDRVFPVEGFTAESMVRGQAVLAESENDPGRLELSVQEHLSRLLTEKQGDWCSQPLAGPRAWDLLALTETQAEANLLGQMEFYRRVQGRPEVALRISDRFDAVYQGHGALAAERARTLEATAEKLQGPERENVFKQAFASAQNALYWSDARTTAFGTAVHIMELYHQSGPPQTFQHMQAIRGALAGDFPRRWWDYKNQVGTQDPQSGARALSYASRQFNVMEQVVEHEPDPQAVERILRDNAHRFVGSPDRLTFLGERARAQGDFAAAEALYQEAKVQSSMEWASYWELARLMVERAEYAGALKTYLEYPPFGDADPEERVGVSNNAAQAGSYLFSRGALDEAVPLFKIAADLNTGSDASLVGSLRLKQLEGRFAEVAGESLARARRYRSPHAYNDYLGWLHALGYSKEAWIGFDELMMSFDHPQVWHSALVGHRVQQHTDEEVRAWLRGERVRGAQMGGYPFAVYHAILANAVDRKPAKDFAAFVAELQEPHRRLGLTRLWSHRPENSETVAMSATAPHGFVSVPYVEPKTEVVYFAEAYSLLRNGDHAGAYRVFTDATLHYDFKYSYAMPYFAWAAAKTGNGDVVEAMLPPRAGFEVTLARAYLAGLKGDHPTAIAHLQRAFAVRPPTDYRPIFTEYQYAEACEWLFLETGHEPYREMALDWVRKLQRIQPMYAWAYAMEAKLTRSAADRTRAVAIAQYLDRRSERLAAIPAKERERAKAWFVRHNPFKSKPIDTATREALKPT